MSWATITSSRTPSAASSRASASTSSIGLVACLPRILGIAQNVHSRSQPSEIFKKGKVPRRDPQPVAIRQRRDWRRLEHGPLLVEPADQPIGDLGHLLAAKDADQMVDVGAGFQQGFFFAFGQAARNDHARGCRRGVSVRASRGSWRTILRGPVR